MMFLANISFSVIWRVEKSIEKLKKNMKTFYAATQCLDSYEAGIEIAEALKAIEPEMVILFSSINYDFEELFKAFYSVLPKDRTQIWGGTGDGI